jgi:hypothetical protein
MNVTPDIIRAIQSAHRHDMVELLPIHAPAIGENAVPGTYYCFPWILILGILVCVFCGVSVFPGGGTMTSF